MAIQPVDLHLHLEKDLTRAELPNLGLEALPWFSHREAFASSIRASLTKKLVSNVANNADDMALAKFLHVNERCNLWELPELTFKHSEILNLFKSEVKGFWERRAIIDDRVVKVPIFDHPFDALKYARFGSGSNVGARGQSFYAKLFSSTLVASDPSLIHWYQYYIRSWPEWSNAENIRQEHFGSPSVIPSGRLSFVPKNDEISRTICVEPTLNTFYQLGFARILEERLERRFGISLTSQPDKNRDLACLGSITEGLSTIDLSSASDSISIKMLEYFFPRDFVAWLKKFRTPFVDVKGHGRVNLNMISTMGNGFTFPLQTILFSCVVAACFRFRGLNPLSKASSDELWGVFGDDIVCPTSVTDDVIAILNILGFVINSDKSFVQGPFRESCGSDFFRGVDIRGVYLKKVDDEASLYSSINSLIRFETRSGIRLEALIGSLFSAVLKLRKEPLLVPPDSDPSCGIHVPFECRRIKMDGPDSISYYRYLSPITPFIAVNDGYLSCPSGVKSLIYNPSGLYISFLMGEIVLSRISIRSDRVRWRPKRRRTSSWSSGVTSEYGRKDHALDWQRWDTAATYYTEKYLSRS